MRRQLRLGGRGRGRRGSVGRRRAGALVGALVLGALVSTSLAGCATDEEATTSPTTEVSWSEADEVAALLAVDRLRPLYGFGFDIREVPVLDERQFGLTSLRGPCGATTATPYLAEGAHRVFRSTISLIVEVVAQPGVPAATELLDRSRADLTPGCPPFEEQVGGATASVQLVEEVRLPELGDQRLAWSQTVTSPEGKVGYRVMVLVREGGRLVVAAVLLSSPIEPEAITNLAAVLTLAAFGPDAVPPGALPTPGTAPATLPDEASPRGAGSPPATASGPSASGPPAKGRPEAGE